MKSEDKELIAGLESWLRQSYATIGQRFDEFVQLIGYPRWHAVPTGGFRQYPYEAMYKYAALEEAIFQNSSAWSDFEILANNNLFIKNHTSNFVRTANGSGRSFSLRELCWSLLPKLRIVDKNTIFADIDVDFKELVNRFFDSIESEYVENLVVWPIYGLGTDSPVNLDDLTEFRELTVDEKIQCLNFGFIDPSNTSEISYENSRWFGLCKTIKDRKFFGNEIDNGAIVYSDRYADLEQVVEDFLVSVPLAVDRVAYHAGGYSTAPHFEQAKHFSWSTTGRGGGSNGLRFLFVDEEVFIDSIGAARLRSVWEFIRTSKKGSFKKRVVNAARRFFYAETRTNQHDTLVDLMIAAESLYLNTGRNELRFRLSLNAVLWSESTEIDPRKVFEAFHKAYDLRSMVVHGSEVSITDVTEINTAIKPILRVGIRKAMERLKLSSEPPEWVDLLFETNLGLR